MLPPNEEILERLLRASGTKSIADLSEILGISRQAAYKAVKERKIPLEWILKISVKYQASMDWLTFGEKDELILPPDKVVVDKKEWVKAQKVMEFFNQLNRSIDNI